MSKAPSKPSTSPPTRWAPGATAKSHWAPRSHEEPRAVGTARDGARSYSPAFGVSFADVGVRQSSARPPVPMPQLAVTAAPASASLQRAKGDNDGKNSKEPKTTSEPGKQTSAPATAGEGGETGEGKDATQLSTREGKLVGNDVIVFDQIEIPEFKTKKHRGALYDSHDLRRVARYKRGNTSQREDWIAHVGKRLDAIKAELRDKLPRKLRGQDGASHVFKYGDTHYYIGDLDTIAAQLAIPKWGPEGEYVQSFEVDHIVELQLAGGEPWGDAIDNMELLERSVNRSSGSTIANAIDRKADAFAKITGGRYGEDGDVIQAEYDLVFETAVASPDGEQPSENESWTMEQILAGRQVKPLKYSADGVDMATDKGKVYVFGNPAGGQPKSFAWRGAIDKGKREHTWLHPFEIVNKEFYTEDADVTKPSLGRLQVEVPPEGTFEGGSKQLDVTRMQGQRHIGHIDKKQVLKDLRARKLSPIRVDSIDIDGDSGIMARGVILPDAPIWKGREIPFELSGGQLTIEHELGAKDLNIPAPFQIHQALLQIIASEAGIGVQGGVKFGIDRVGKGHVEAGMDENGLSLTGSFDFDSSIFDPASVKLGYENGQFQGGAEIGIPAGKVPGIDKATLGVTIAGDSISGQGTLKPALPGFQPGTFGLSYSPAEGLGLKADVALDMAPLDRTTATLAYKNGQFSGTVKTGIAAGRIPGIKSAALTLQVDGEKISGTGTLQPALPGFQPAQVTVEHDPTKGLSLGGKFAFDTGLFERTELELGYANGEVHGGGDVHLAKGRVPGVDTASLAVRFHDGQVSGKGTLTPALPGLKQADVWFSHEQSKGYRIGGHLAVADIPYVQQGELTAEVSADKGGKSYGLTASGDLTVGVAGLTARATADYDRGTFMVAGKTDWKHGKASGTIEIGATNRVVDKDGKLLRQLGAGIVPFGRGSVTLSLTDWLTGTAGIRLLPSGEFEIDGALDIPDQVELFKRRSFDKKLFSIDVPIPIFGPLRAKISGGMSLDAGIGPGTLREAGLHVTYNPGHPDKTKVDGKARFVVPADAGLTLFVRGSLGVGLLVADADLGLEASGRMGIEGALDNSIAVTWTPAKGVSIDANAVIQAQPRFRFAISGFASASFLTMDWEKKWELASYEYGSALRFAMKVPIHYDSQNGFVLSWDAVEFETPNLDAATLIQGLLDNSGNEQEKEKNAGNQASKNKK